MNNFFDKLSIRYYLVEKGLSQSIFQKKYIQFKKYLITHQYFIL